MADRLSSFRDQESPEGRVVRTRYDLRTTKPPLKRDQSIVTYRQPGRGVSGESSN